MTGRFRKSTFCSLGDCPEVSYDEDADVVILRNSADRSAELLFTREEWMAFVEAAKAGEYQLPQN